MSVLAEKLVTPPSRNRNQGVTKSNNGTITTYTHSVTGNGCAREAETICIFDVGTDALELGMQVFTQLALIKKQKGERPLSIPLEAWKAVCLARGLTEKQFTLLKAYCDALHVYTEKDGFILVDPGFVLLEHEQLTSSQDAHQSPLPGAPVSPNSLTEGGIPHEYH
jgi:hypothetical protein